MQAQPYSVLTAILRLLLLLGWIILATLYFFAAKLVRFAGLERIPMGFHRGCCRILPIRTKFSGRLCSHRPTLYVSNHISYLDIFVLGGKVPGCFIAKSEVAKWPVLGRLARLQNTLFFERNGRRARSQIEVMGKHLGTKGNLILFPEGTSTEGTHVEPFKSSLFHAAETADEVSIQPITIAYTHYRGRLMEKPLRDYFAWYATMPFASHFFQMAGMARVTAEVIFHPPVRLGDFDCRKSCADYCQRQIATGLDQVLDNSSALPAGEPAAQPGNDRKTASRV